MHIDPTEHPVADNYKLITNLVVPRPIAWITSSGPDGIVNLAPFSFFNAVASDPLYLIVSVGHRDSGAPKDTARNIETRREFVVNLVTEELLDAMNVSAADFPPDRSELEATGLATEASLRVAPPRLAAAGASLECRLFQALPLGESTLFVAEVVMFHVADRYLGPRLRVENFAPVGRLGSPSLYCRTIDRFALPRISFAEWQKMGGT
jgi:flavin reductase (DIM6/NTAB) family NADH-FMN oxidoreductase RutF